MNTALISILFLSAINTSSSKVVRVREGNQETKEFKTIQECVDDIDAKWKATCKIHTGVYHEQVDIKNKKDITIEPHEDNTGRVVIDGTVELKPKDGEEWKRDSENRCYGILDETLHKGTWGHDVFQLFLDGKMMTNARWPNALWNDDDKTVFDEKYWAHSHNSTFSKRGELIGDGENRYRISTMVDDGTAGLDKLQFKLNSDDDTAMAVLNVGSFNTFVKPVLDHKSGTNSFTYKDDFDTFKCKKDDDGECEKDEAGEIKWVQTAIQYYPEHNRYYLDSKLEFLDNPGEWHFNKKTRQLTFLPFKDTCSNPGKGDCKCPDVNDNSTGILRGRVMDYSMIIFNTSSATVRDIDFFASTISATNSRKRKFRKMVLDSVKFEFPSSSRRMLKDPAVPKSTELFTNMIGKPRKNGKVNKNWTPGHVEVVNCNFTGAEGFALQFKGITSKIYNNLFEWNDWTGQMSLKVDGGGGTVACYAGSEDSQFVGNTLRNNGASAGYRPGKKGMVRDNIIEGQCKGKIMNDGAGVQVQVPQQNGTILKSNWVYDSPKYALRFDGAPKIKDDNTAVPLGEYGEMYGNVQWNSGPFQVKGDKHTVERNLALGNKQKEDEWEAEGKGKWVPGLKSICLLREYTTVTNTNTNLTNNAWVRADGGAIDRKWQKREGNNTYDYGFESCGSEYLSKKEECQNGNPRKECRKVWDLAGSQTNNYNGDDLTLKSDDLHRLLVDIDNYDFRPVSKNIFAETGKGTITDETGDQIGPYQAKDEDITQYLIPGRKEYLRASHPIPRNGSEVMERDVLMFRPGFRCDSHKAYVWYGTKSISEELLSVDNEYESNYKNVIALPGKPKGSDLKPGTHTWKVDCLTKEACEMEGERSVTMERTAICRDGKKVYEGEEWIFTIKN